MCVDQSSALRYVDVGALGGVPDHFRTEAARIWPVLFEPNEQEIDRIRLSLAAYPNSTVLPLALGHYDGPATLYRTRNATCCSILRPNMNVLDQYGISYHFHVEGQSEVELARYDTLCARGIVPCPDAIKIDVQGFEFEVLNGFGGLLRDCLAIQLESHFYPIYVGQKSFSEIVAYLSCFGFRLRRIDSNKMEHFAGDLVEFDALFTKDRRYIKQRSPEVMLKFNLIAELWGLESYDLALP